ncbi:MAG TPA: Ig-like domain repeat protein, partial [Terriglobales bacterium]
ANAVEIKNIKTTGLTNSPFTAVIPHRGVCPTTGSLSSSENPSTYGDTVTFLASVSGGVGTPTGTVTFKDNGTSIGAGTLNNSGQASLSISNLSAGSHQITAAYSGDATHASSVSDALAQVVNPAPLTITADNKSRLLDSPNPPLTATYSGFVLGEGPGVLTGTLSCTTTALTNSPAGDYPITCSGQSSPNYGITYVPGTLSVIFASAGSCLGEPGHAILAPIAANGTSVFNSGRTVPAKFRVCDANGVSIGTPGTVSSFNIVQVITGTTSDVNLSVDSTTPDTAFRWDPTAQEWIFNISTRGLATGATYVFRIGLADGSNITFQFGLR